MKIKYLTSIVIGGCCLVGVARSAPFNAASHEITTAQCLYLPPSFADRVVYYQGFDAAGGEPEINRINAKTSGAMPLIHDGFAGSGCRSCQPQHGEKPLQIHSPKLSPDHPMTVMRWWRVDAPMKDVSGFQLLALEGHGHISCFIRGKGEWCALQRPTIFVQVDGIPSITNVNWGVRDNAYFQPGDWHHTAITIAGGSEINFYLDGQPLASVHCKGRQFKADDLDTLQAASDSGNYPEHPTSTDELVVVDRVLSAQEIQQYCQASMKLREMHYAPLLAVATRR